jgi:dGTPase
MLRTERAEREKRQLEPFAVCNLDTIGRRYPETEHPARLPFERDRDRVIHSRCFRRLEYKTQVFVNHTADHYRTRLTHTMEMAAVCRTLARFFNVSEDLSEAIALAHDIGHTPIGHVGEHALDLLMKQHGGFDHNFQSLRWVEFLEAQYPDFPGLNLSWEVRAGLLKKQPHINALDRHPLPPRPSLEAQIADIADDLTYYAHDTDDALEAGLLSRSQLVKQELWRMAETRTNNQFTALPDVQFVRLTIRNLLDLLVSDVMGVGARRLQKLNPQSPDDITHADRPMVAFSDTIAEATEAFRDFLYREFYFSPAVQEPSGEAIERMERLFYHFLKHPEDMGGRWPARIEQEGLERTVCDFLSGFTDRYIYSECNRLGLDRPSRRYPPVPHPFKRKRPEAKLGPLFEEIRNTPRNPHPGR